MKPDKDNQGKPNKPDTPKGPPDGRPPENPGHGRPDDKPPKPPVRPVG